LFPSIVPEPDAIVFAGDSGFQWSGCDSGSQKAEGDSGRLSIVIAEGAGGRSSQLMTEPD